MIINRTITGCLTALALCSAMSCRVNVDDKTYNAGIHVIPQPNEMTTGEGAFEINGSTTIGTEGAEWTDEVALLKGKLEKASGLTIDPMPEGETFNCILLKKDDNLGEEEYKVDVTDSMVTLTASSEKGMFYAVQTLLQLLPAEVEIAEASRIDMSIPCVSISDSPRFSYRGLMIDPCRHFFSVDELKRQLDVMSMLKMNTLHLHLTDNQGWRIAIDKYPQLVECSAVQETYNGEKYGPYYYTKEDIKELVEYADSLHIDVIPEIEFPGHSLGALVAFPELSCTGGPFESEQVFGYEENVFCIGNDSVFTLMEDVLREVAAMFPSEYLHIGGDECVKSRWHECPRCQDLAKRLGIKATPEHSVEEQLQSYGIKRMERFISQELGKRMIGWEEILEGGLPDEATVMSWKGTECGAKAASTAHNVVMASMADGLYLCSAQGADEVEPAAMGGQSYLKDVYAFDPLPKELDPEMHKYIIGTQACLWSEWTPDVEMLEYLLYPRLMALAEVAWTAPEKKDWEDFQRRLDNMQVRLDERGIGYHIPIPEGELTTNRVFTGDSVVMTFTNSRSLPMVYTTDGTEPGLKSTPLPDSLVLSEPCTLKVATVTAGGRLSPVRTLAIEKQDYVPAVAGDTTKVRLQLADGLFRNDSEYGKAVFHTDTVIGAISDYNKSNFDYKKPSLAVYTGFFNVPETGIYTFKSLADELWVGDSRLVYNPTSSRFYEKKTQIALEKGVHPFRLVVSNHLKEGFAPGWYAIDFQFEQQK